MQKGILMTVENGIKCHNKTKTETRRTQGLEYVNIHPDQWVNQGFADGQYLFNTKDNSDYVFVKPRYQVGDVLAIRETHYVYGHWINAEENNKFQKGRMFIAHEDKPVYFTDTLPKNIEICRGFDCVGYYKRPSLFMRNEHVRTFRNVKEVDCERLHDITELGAFAEGIEDDNEDYCLAENHQNAGVSVCPAIYAYSCLWDSINFKTHPWDSNPWDFVYKF